MHFFVLSRLMSLVSLSFAAGEIQRILRGLIGRGRAQAQYTSKMDNRQASLYFYLCIQIQKSFRGYYSRKYKHDQARRKRDCAELAAKNDRVRFETETFARDQE